MVWRADSGARLALICALAAHGASGCATSADDRSSAPAEWSSKAPDAAASFDEGAATSRTDTDDAHQGAEHAAPPGQPPASEQVGGGPSSSASPPPPDPEASELAGTPDASTASDAGANAVIDAEREGSADPYGSAVSDARANADAREFDVALGPIPPAANGEAGTEPDAQSAGDVPSAGDEVSALDAGAPPSEAGALLDDGAARADDIVINEVESSGGVPGDWVELYNAGTAPVDVSGWTLKDSDESHAYVLASPSSPEPEPEIVEPGGYVVLDESAFGFGLGAADSVRLFNREGQLVATTSWTAHAVTTYGRCPGHGGELVTTLAPTKGGPNSCASLGDGPVEAGVPLDPSVPSGVADLPWPGGLDVSTVDPPGAYAGNLSGLAYQPGWSGSPDTIWAVQNDPSMLYALQADPIGGGSWLAVAGDGGQAAQALRYPDGSGAPDSEGVTLAEWDADAVYVAAERDNLHDTVSRLSVLRYDVSSRGAELVATHEWNLTADLPVTGPNDGLEGITWVPDGDLTAMGFLDERRSTRYDPVAYPNHGTGLFLVGLESNGMIYAYALDHQSGAAYRVAAMTSGQRAVMDLAFDRELHQLWAYCDNTCGNRATVLALTPTPTGEDSATFVVRAAFERPSALGDLNNEGITLAPESACAGGFKPFFWSDDSATDGHSIRRGTVACRALP